MGALWGKTRANMKGGRDGRGESRGRAIKLDVPDVKAGLYVIR